MKLLIALLLTCSIFAQTDKLCEQRGHVKPDITSITDMYCPPRYEDFIDRTLMIIWDQNIVSYRCLRCGEEVREPVQAKPDTTIFWLKFPETEDRDFGTPYKDSVKITWTGIRRKLYSQDFWYEFGLREDGVVVWRKQK